MKPKNQNYKKVWKMKQIEVILSKNANIKSEAGIMLKCESAVIPSEIRDFSLDDTFAVFLIESSKDKPYFAGKINDVTKFQ